MRDRPRTSMYVSLRADSALLSLWSPSETLHVCFIFIRCYFVEFMRIFFFVVSHLHNVLNDF